MLTHVKVLGWLNIVFGAIGVLVALGFMAFFASIATLVGIEAPEEARVAVPVLGSVGLFLGVFVMALSIPGIVTGFGLLAMKPWARILGIVVSALSLINVPIGTLLGIYGLWVLLSTETVALFENRRALGASASPSPYMK